MERHARGDYLGPARAVAAKLVRHAAVARAGGEHEHLGVVACRQTLRHLLGDDGRTPETPWREEHVHHQHAQLLPTQRRRTRQQRRGLVGGDPRGIVGRAHPRHGALAHLATQRRVRDQAAQRRHPRRLVAREEAVHTIRDRACELARRRTHRRQPHDRGLDQLDVALGVVEDRALERCDRNVGAREKGQIRLEAGEWHALDPVRERCEPEVELELSHQAEPHPRILAHQTLDRGRRHREIRIMRLGAGAIRNDDRIIGPPLACGTRARLGPRPDRLRVERVLHHQARLAARVGHQCRERRGRRDRPVRRQHRHPIQRRTAQQARLYLARQRLQIRVLAIQPDIEDEIVHLPERRHPEPPRLGQQIEVRPLPRHPIQDQVRVHLQRRTRLDRQAPVDHRAAHAEPLDLLAPLPHPVFRALRDAELRHDQHAALEPHRRGLGECGLVGIGGIHLRDGRRGRCRRQPPPHERQRAAHALLAQRACRPTHQQACETNPVARLPVQNAVHDRARARQQPWSHEVLVAEDRGAGRVEQRAFYEDIRKT